MSRRRQVVQRTRSALAAFLETEAAGGVVLVASAVAGMLWANLLPGYESFWHSAVSIAGQEMDLQHWVNDGLMTIFFLVVGLEIKREIVAGDLQDPRVAALPGAAAVGGMVLPALIFVAVSGGGDAAAGWGIPMATDIAFVVGALALMGSRVPQGLKVFLLTLAIVDDVGAIIVIALFYSRGVDVLWLLVTVGTFAVVLLLRVVGVAHPLVYVVAGVLAWASMLPSGIHPTLAGVTLGLLTPARPVRNRAVLETLQRWLHPLSSFIVVPTFALANAGLVITGETVMSSLASRVFWAVVLGLLVGKTVGIAGTSWVTQRLRIGRPPPGVGSHHLVGGAALAGIGFTVSLFIAGLAFESGALADQARMGILFGSFASAIAGVVALSLGRRNAGAAGD